MKYNPPIICHLLLLAVTSNPLWGCSIATQSEVSEEAGLFDEAAQSASADTGGPLAGGAEAQKAAIYTMFVHGGKEGASETNSVASTGKLCVLGSIWGDTHGWDGAKRGFNLFRQYADFLYPYQRSADTWWLNIYDLPARVGGTCVNRSAFQLPSGGKVEFPYQAWASAHASFFGYSDVPFSSGDTVSLLVGLTSQPDGILDGGGFEGMGELVRVNQSNSVNEPHVVRADTGHNGNVWGRAEAFRAGLPGLRPKFYGYKDGSMVRARWGTSGTFTMNISTFSGYSSYWMAQTSDAICVMTRYQGRLAGTDSHVRGYLHGTQWRSVIKSTYQAEAAYRCAAYDQR